MLFNYLHFKILICDIFGGWFLWRKIIGTLNRSKTEVVAERAGDIIALKTNDACRCSSYFFGKMVHYTFIKIWFSLCSNRFLYLVRIDIYLWSSINFTRCFSTRSYWVIRTFTFWFLLLKVNFSCLFFTIFFNNSEIICYFIFIVSQALYVIKIIFHILYKFI